MNQVNDGRLVRAKIKNKDKWLHARLRNHHTVWILVYTHRLDVDVSAYVNEYNAVLAAQDIAEEYREHFNVDPDIGIDEARLRWSELTNGEENLELDSYPIYRRNPEW